MSPLKKNSDVDSDIFKILFFFNISNTYKKTTYILHVNSILFPFWEEIFQMIFFRL